MLLIPYYIWARIEHNIPESPRWLVSADRIDEASQFSSILVNYRHFSPLLATSRLISPHFTSFFGFFCLFLPSFGLFLSIRGCGGAGKGRAEL